MHLRFGPVARGGLRWSDRAAGLPHRSAGAGEGAAGQERRHRAGRRQGRFLPEAAAAGGGSRDECSRQAVRPTCNFISSCFRSPTIFDGQTVVPPDGRACAGRRRSLFRRRRRQGHGDLLRHRQRHQPVARLLARRCLRLRRLGRLRPQEDGHHRARRLGGGQAALPRDEPRHPDRRPSPSSASATCRATSSATACCCRRANPPCRGLRSPRHLHRPGSGCRSFVWQSASACSPCRVRAGRTMTCRSSCRRAAASFARPEVADAVEAKPPPPSASTRPRHRPAEIMNAILKAQVDLFWFGGIGTYVRATSRKQSGCRRPRQ